MPIGPQLRVYLAGKLAVLVVIRVANTLGAMTVYSNLTASRSGFRSSSMRSERLLRVAMMMTVWSFGCLCYGQTEQQKFTVNVAEGIAVTTPPQPEINIELTPGFDAFPVQLWNVRSNSVAGAVVEFATSGAFAHETMTGVKVDAGLDVAISSSTGPSNWLVTQGSDNSSYATGDESAVVQIVADGVGTAQVGLTMRFVQSSLEVIPVGEYSSTVTCTVALP
jgi:spore coat protein U-like protein